MVKKNIYLGGKNFLPNACSILKVPAALFVNSKEWPCRQDEGSKGEKKDLCYKIPNPICSDTKAQATFKIISKTTSASQAENLLCDGGRDSNPFVVILHIVKLKDF